VIHRRGLSIDAETGTISGFAIQEGPSSFAIFDTFDDEAGRDAHLNGKVAAASFHLCSSAITFGPEQSPQKGRAAALHINSNA
jgi:hypothetical protein